MENLVVFCDGMLYNVKDKLFVYGELYGSR